MENDISPFTALLMVAASSAIALYFTRDRQDPAHVNIFSRNNAMMHKLFVLRQAQVDKMDSGAYEGRGRLLKDDIERLDLYVPFILRKAPNDEIGCSAKIRCNILFAKLEEVNWVIPVDGALMKELEGCEFELTTAAVVVVSNRFLLFLPSSPDPPF